MAYTLAYVVFLLYLCSRKGQKTSTAGTGSVKSGASLTDVKQVKICDETHIECSARVVPTTRNQHKHRIDIKGVY